MVNRGRKSGAVDKRQRKIRSDTGKKHKTYNGKPCVRKLKKHYPKKTGHKTHIKIWIWKLEVMSKDGYKRWNRNIRRKINQTIWIPQNIDHVYLVPVSEICNQEKLGQFVSDRYFEGTWAVMGFTNKRNRFHCSPKCKAIIVIGSNDEGNYVKSFKDRGMYRYFFWKR